MQANSSKSCNACRLHCPRAALPRLELLYDLPLLLSSAAALPVLWQCGLITVYRCTDQCGERSNAAFRTQSAARLSSLAPHDSKARLKTVTNRRDSWRSHVHRTHTAQRVQSFKNKTRNVGGRGVPPSSFSGGIQRGYSLREENTPFDCALPCQWEPPFSAFALKKPM